MPEITVIECTRALEPAAGGTPPRRRVAAYARVSTEKDEQQSSYEAQRAYYTRMIDSRADWDFAGVYADEYSGTGTKNRAGFLRMIGDALGGGIDLIVTKSVARFARNTVDSLTHIRMLREHGTEIYFEKENIWTFDEKGELMITILSSLAQEESRSISENVTWGMRESMRRGNAWVPYKAFLGYDRGPDGGMVVNPAQAALVRRVYGLYAQGVSPYHIARLLEREGAEFAPGRAKWHATTVASILRNEKYKGDALRQKTYSKSFLTKERAKNNGELRQYYIRGHHEAIVAPRLFDRVQREIAKRGNAGEPRGAERLFEKRLVCGECGGYYVRETAEAGAEAVWRCARKDEDGAPACASPAFGEEALKAAVAEAMASRFADLLPEAFQAAADAVAAVALPSRGRRREAPDEASPAVPAIPSLPFSADLWYNLAERLTVTAGGILLTFRDGTELAVPCVR